MNTDINETWDPYSKAGFAVEEEFLAWLHEQGHVGATRSEGNFKEFDIHCPHCDKTWEVKRDYKSAETGNFAIEIDCFGKPSGIKATTADYWVIATERHFYVILTVSLIAYLKTIYWEYEQLKAQGNELAVARYRVVMGGDGNQSKMVLIPVEDFSREKRTSITLIIRKIV